MGNPQQLSSRRPRPARTDAQPRPPASMQRESPAAANRRQVRTLLWMLRDVGGLRREAPKTNPPLLRSWRRPAVPDPCTKSAGQLPSSRWCARFLLSRRVRYRSEFGTMQSPRNTSLVATQCHAAVTPPPRRRSGGGTAGQRDKPRQTTAAADFCCPGSRPEQLDLSQPEPFRLLGKHQQQVIAQQLIHATHRARAYSHWSSCAPGR